MKIDAEAAKVDANRINENKELKRQDAKIEFSNEKNEKYEADIEALKTKYEAEIHELKQRLM